MPRSGREVRGAQGAGQELKVKTFRSGIGGNPRLPSLTACRGLGHRRRAGLGHLAGQASERGRRHRQNRDGDRGHQDDGHYFHCHRARGRRPRLYLGAARCGIPFNSRGGPKGRPGVIEVAASGRARVSSGCRIWRCWRSRRRVLPGRPIRHSHSRQGCRCRSTCGPAGRSCRRCGGRGEGMGS
jgi:hypothetical protein